MVSRKEQLGPATRRIHETLLAQLITLPPSPINYYVELLVAVSLYLAVITRDAEQTNKCQGHVASAFYAYPPIQPTGRN